ncbi:alginate lyase family protein [Mesohalobacter halotolerans]|uniref:Prenyltransferase n=1 Tax=Mesohalobacter halotolerans TaxID=1883405 RepID=A0A4U5TSI5_9FLAO|nr:alginate lyase family protein [Mesohalobacter halotolerans]TKS56982.1 prenyltransferase [Mesohalobacter halotolerans]
MNKLHLILHTVKHLQPIQILYQLWYRLRRMWRKATGFKYPLSIEKQGIPARLQPWFEKPVSFSDGSFTLLNLSKKYVAGNINWNEPDHGKLWAYNLNYMDYLLQPGMDKQTGLQLIENFIQYLPQNPTALEPYPIALRGINWIKFLSSNVIAREAKQPAEIQHINSSLYSQYLILFDNIEYHLLANHLLEDGFSLLFGGFYFLDQKLYNKGKEIVEKELKEQILDDGAHFELSPMYHQIILDRLLDCINLVKNNQRFNNQQQLLELMKEKTQKMLSWLNNMTFSTGEIPLLNDSAPCIAPTTQQLNKYALSLKLQPATCNLQLGASGYRKFSTPSYECIIDIGQIGPSYQPGHAHADTFNLILNVKNEPVIVDTGISTYDSGETRLKERETAAHNTVTVQDKNSSEVWSSFRVARRAKVNVLKNDKNNIIAQHDGYKKLGTVHQREWHFTDNAIEIIDTLIGKEQEGKSHIWISSQQKPIKGDNYIEIQDAVFKFENVLNIKLIPTKIPVGYNQFSKNFKIEISFKNKLHTYINIFNL